MSCSISVPAAESSLKVLRQKHFTSKNKQAEFDLQFESSISRHIRSGRSQSTINFPDFLLFFPLLTILHFTKPLFCLLCQGWLRPQEASENEYGEEDHGEATAGGVQPTGQRAGTHAPAPSLLWALPPTAPHDTKRAGGEALHDAACFQPGEREMAVYIKKFYCTDTLKHTWWLFFSLSFWFISFIIITPEVNLIKI